MKPVVKGGIGTAGYIGGVLVASGGVAIRVASTSGPDAQASGGMYAFGDSFVFVTVFSLAALLPTGAALFFLRTYRPFWTVLSALGVAVAVTGVSAAVLYTLGRLASHSPLATLAGLSVLRMLVSPLLALLLFVCTALSPFRSPRLALLAAAVMEAAASMCVASVLLIHIYFPSL